jgi:hypothetical protein
LLALGLGSVVALVHLAGAHEIARVVGRCAPAIPLLLLVEAARIALEARAVRDLYRALGAEVPLPALGRAHLVGYAMTTVLPAGRAVAEGYVATALVRFASPGRAAAAGTLNHALAMAANASVAALCFAACFMATGLSKLTVAIGLHTLFVGALALVLPVVARSRRAYAAATRAIRAVVGETRAERLTRGLEAMGDASRLHLGVPWGALGAHLVARGLQTVGIAALLATIAGVRGTSALRLGLFGQAVHLVGTSAGDLVPLQLGATDVGFALAAPALGMTVADAVAAALVLHGIHLAWSVVGALVPLVWRCEKTEAER